VKWVVSVFTVALALGGALLPHGARAQQPDPLISPPEGDVGSRFQIVGQFGWTPGETVTIRLGFTPADPASYSGPYYHERQTTVLRDGTWSFPIVLSDDLFPFPLDGRPGWIVVQAQSPSKTATNAFAYAPGGVRPAGAVGSFGFGPQAASPFALLLLALFAGGGGGLLIALGAARASEARAHA